jgi:regulator of protease activity HflC (stomatin/prohibitin superfamily)
MRNNAQRAYGYFSNGTQPLRRGRRVSVNEWETAILYRHGRLEGALAPGAHRRWGAGYTIRAIDTRPWVVTVPTQEIPTADGAPVKVTVAGLARITDAKTYVSAARDATEALYLAIQVAMRDIVANTTMDDLLAGRLALSERLLAAVTATAELGLEVTQLVIKDIILPSELKRALSEVLMARASGNAALERARGETAALRNLANAARMAADNPALLQLRLLQQLEGSKGHTVVIGTAPLGAVASSVG